MHFTPLFSLVVVTLLMADPLKMCSCVWVGNKICIHLNLIPYDIYFCKMHNNNTSNINVALHQPVRRIFSCFILVSNVHEIFALAPLGALKESITNKMTGKVIIKARIFFLKQWENCHILFVYNNGYFLLLLLVVLIVLHANIFESKEP